MIQTIDPRLVDLNFANSVNELVSSTDNFIKIVEDYPNEITTAQYYSYCNQFNIDSIEEFFTKLHNSDISQDDINNIHIEDSKIEVKNNIGFEEFDAQFKLYWLEKFWRCHTYTKRAVLSTIGDDNEYYTSFSESIGSLNYLENTNNNSTLKWSPDSVDEYNIPGQTYEKIKHNSIVTDIYMIKLTNTLFKTNLAALPTTDDRQSTDITTSNTSHGMNLITDSIHYDRVKESIADMKSSIQTYLQGLFDVYRFIKMSVNEQFVNNIEIDNAVNGSMEKVSILMHKLEQETSQRSNETILG